MTRERPSKGRCRMCGESFLIEEMISIPGQRIWVEESGMWTDNGYLVCKKDYKKYCEK